MTHLVAASTYRRYVGGVLRGGLFLRVLGGVLASSLLAAPAASANPEGPAGCNPKSYMSESDYSALSAGQRADIEGGSGATASSSPAPAEQPAAPTTTQQATPITTQQTSPVTTRAVPVATAQPAPRATARQPARAVVHSHSGATRASSQKTVHAVAEAPRQAATDGETPAIGATPVARRKARARLEKGNPTAPEHPVRGDRVGSQVGRQAPGSPRSAAERPPARLEVNRPSQVSRADPGFGASQAVAVLVLALMAAGLLIAHRRRPGSDGARTATSSPQDPSSHGRPEGTPEPVEAELQEMISEQRARAEIGRADDARTGEPVG